MTCWGSRRAAIARGAIALGTVFIIVSSGCETAPPAPDAGGDASVRCALNSECDDGVFCNGTEVCDPGAAGASAAGCAPGPAPCAAPAVCDETSDACLTTCTDADGDGHPSTSCGGDDCDDADAARYPGNVEVCDVDAHDEDCDDTTLGARDVDGDDATSIACCNGTTCGADCDDTRRGTNPGVPEVCDEIDNDCDGAVDEGLVTRLHLDADHDGVGDAAREVIACPGAPGAAAAIGDCDDTRASVRPTAPEICDEIDNDCDGTVDEATVAVPWYVDLDGDGWGTVSATAPSVDSCVEPADRAIRVGDCDDGDAMVSPTAVERCNGRDDDCDGRADYLVGGRDTEDDDLDGVPDPACAAASADCNDRDPLISVAASVEICDDRDNDCDTRVDEGATPVDWYVDMDGDRFGDPASTPVTSCDIQPGRTLDRTDCDDRDPGTHPEAVDSCTGRLFVDDDCDGTIDEGGVALTVYVDLDGDGYGTGEPIRSCLQESMTSTRGGDCDDAEGRVNPGQLDDCAAIAGVDDDCDGRVDETLVPRTFYADPDGDGFGSGSGTSGCEQPAGTATQNGDCDETTILRNPGVPDDCATQIGVDDDCDAATDEGRVLRDFYADLDRDGFGAGPVIQACSAPTGTVAYDGDCDDSSAMRNPGAPDDCSRPMAVDDDCDGRIDEAAMFTTVYRDVDGDGYGSGSSMVSCGVPLGFVTANGDCNEADVAIHPMRPDDCTTRAAVDDDCDVTVDEDVVLRAFYPDSDGDGYGTGTAVMACSAPTGHGALGGDCDDTNRNRNPGRADDCSGVAALDDDCDTRVDEAIVRTTYYRDADGDTYGDATVTMQLCAPITGYVSRALDCDDSRSSVRPGAPEVCANALDDDCDTLRDCADSSCSASCAGTLSIVSGGGQSGAIHAPLGMPLRVRLTDSGGTPLTGRSVQLDTTSVTADAYTGTTDASGEVVFTGLRAPFVLGTETVRLVGLGAPDLTTTFIGTAPAAGTIFSVLNGRRDTDPPFTGLPTFDASVVGNSSGLTGTSDGTIYFANSNRIWRARADGSVEPVAGVGCCATTLGSVPAPALSIYIGGTDIITTAYDEVQNRLYFSQGCGIYAVDLATGIMSGVMGRYNECNAMPTGDGGLAVDARGDNIYSMALTDSGLLWFMAGRFIRMIDTAGVISTPLRQYQGDASIRATAFVGPVGEIPGSDDVLMFGDVEVASVIRPSIIRLTPGGVMTHLAGGTSTAAAAYDDGVAALSARLDNDATGMMLPGGDIVIAERGFHRIRRLSAATGTFTTIAGTRGTAGDTGDGGAATGALLRLPASLETWHDTHLIFWNVTSTISIRAIW